MRSNDARLRLAATLLAAAALLVAGCSRAITLGVGECFDPPTTIGETVDEVVRKACTEPHGAEVVYVGDYSGPADGYPTDDQFLAFSESTCQPAFNAYTGLDFATAADFDMGAFTPTSDGWASGDRRVTCYAVSLGDPLTRSIRKP